MVSKKIIYTVLTILFLTSAPASFSQQKEETPGIEDSEVKAKLSENNSKAEFHSSGEEDANFKKYTKLSPEIKSPEELLGLTPEKAYEELGAPEEVFSMRGKREWQDDVVFYYKNHIYLFWFKNRVWQFRADMRFRGTVLDLKQGMERKQVASILGKPMKSEEGSEIYLNPKNITRYETGFPVRMKVFYDEDNRVSDIYVYRGDF